MACSSYFEALSAEFVYIILILSAYNTVIICHFYR